MCSLYARSGAEYLAGIASVLSSRDVFLSPGALARSAFENGVRGVLLLDPRTTARARSARAMLDEIASADKLRLTLKHLSGAADPFYVQTKTVLAELRASAEAAFSTVSWTGDAHKWRIEEEAYLRMNEAAESWSA